MPRLWDDTIEAHQQAVRRAIFGAAHALVEEDGVTGLTMSRLAQKAGIGRATLYKYFGDVQEILVAWHQQMIEAHLSELERVRGRHTEPLAAMEAVLLAYGEIVRRHHGHALSGLLHTLPHVEKARDRLRAFLRELVSAAAAANWVRNDVSHDELASYAYGAIAGAASCSTRAAVRRLVRLTMDGLTGPHLQQADKGGAA